ncbi:MAG: ABC transporter substrate-binding protein [Deltaproteobacteria bacterium]|nr:ABC transporter substrate-binding protein [Deltaproteobacteria bacterium]MBI3078122.1 ABC transporter substrate-binding protein [Deltaproteobacteria bacterium]
MQQLPSAGRRRTARTIGLALVLLLPLPAEAAQERLAAAYSTLVGSQAVIWVAHDSGSFERAGLPLTLVYVQGGPQAAAGLLSGSIPFVQFSASAGVNAALGGADVAFVTSGGNTPYFQLMGAPGIRSAADLKGKIVAVQRLGADNSYTLARFAIRHLGLDPDRDVSYRQIGVQSARVAAVRSGVVQATLLSSPITVQARKAGLSLLIDLMEMKLDYFMVGQATTRSFIQRNPEAVRRFVRGIVLGIHFYKTRKAESMRTIGKYMKLTDQDALEDAYRVYSQGIVARKPYPSPTGFEHFLKDLAQEDPRARGMRPEQFMDVRFLRELDESGFIDRLYAP